MPGPRELLAHCDIERPVVVQVHDFPDHDAVASAFAVYVLMQDAGYTVRLCYGGQIQSNSLRDAIDALGIPIVSCSELRLQTQPQLIVVDGFFGNSNVVGFDADLVGTIDHHPPPCTPAHGYVDIRDTYGSCSTILYEYLRQSDIDMDDRLATALLMGLMMDTAFMTRGVSEADLDAFGQLFRSGDWRLATRLLKNSLSLSDLATFRQAIDACVVAEDFAFVSLQGGITVEVMALIADFLLGLREIEFVVVVSGDRDEHRISVRSEDQNRPCDLVIHAALRGVGSGGGHMHMGGGSVPLDLYPGDEGLRRRFLHAQGATFDG